MRAGECCLYREYLRCCNGSVSIRGHRQDWFRPIEIPYSTTLIFLHTYFKKINEGSWNADFIKVSNTIKDTGRKAAKVSLDGSVVAATAALETKEEHRGSFRQKDFYK